MTPEELDELERRRLAAERWGPDSRDEKSFTAMLRGYATQLLTAARELHAIRAASGLTAEQRQVLEAVEEPATDAALRTIDSQAAQLRDVTAERDNASQSARDSRCGRLSHRGPNGLVNGPTPRA